MSCKSALYGANTSSQTLANASINFGQIVRRFGQNINLSGGNVVIDGMGYYDIDANIGFTASATSTTISILKDGVAVPGATSTITTVSGDNYSVTIPSVIRQMCCCESMITVVISAGTVTNAAISVEKI